MAKTRGEANPFLLLSRCSEMRSLSPYAAPRPVVFASFLVRCPCTTHNPVVVLSILQQFVTTKNKQQARVLSIPAPSRMLRQPGKVSYTTTESGYKTRKESLLLELP